MPQYIDMPCPRCNRGLRIRTNYVGLRLQCKYCEHKFQVPADANVVSATPPASPDATQAAEKEALGERLTALEAELAKVRNELTAVTAERESSVRYLQQARDELARERERATDLQSRLEHASQTNGDTVRQQQEAEAIRAQRDEMTSEVNALRERVGTLERLEVELKTARAEVARFEAERQSAGQRNDSAAAELVSARADNDRLSGEVQQLRDKLSQSEADLGKLESELANRQRELGEMRQQAEMHHQGLSNERKRRAEAEEQANAARQEAEKHRSATTTAEQSLTAERAKWQSEQDAAATAARQEREAVERDLAAVRAERDGLAAEQRQLQDQIAGEVKTREQLDRDLADLRKEIDAARGEITTLSQERDAEAAERKAAAERHRAAEADAETLRSRVGALEQSLADALRQHDETRTITAKTLEDERNAWHGEKTELTSRWEEQHQAVKADAERQRQEDIARHASEREQLANQLKEAHTRFEDDCTALRRELAEAERQTAGLRQERDELTQKLAVLEENLCSLRADFERTRGERESEALDREVLAAKLTPLQSECEELRQLELSGRRRVAALEEELQAARGRVEDAELRLADVLAGEHERMLAEMDGRDRLVASTRQEFEEERGRLNAELARSRDELAALKSTLQMMGIML